MFSALKAVRFSNEQLMAIKSTIFKANLSVSDMDRPHYGTYSLTLARHPSETDERMMVRILAFALYADEALAFGKGISDEDEAALWRKDLTGAVELWIEVGLPDETRVKKASGRSDKVVVLTYGGRIADMWWQKNASKLARFSNLSVMNLPTEASEALAALAERGMDLQCTVQDGQIWFSGGETTVHLEVSTLKAAA